MPVTDSPVDTVVLTENDRDRMVRRLTLATEAIAAVLNGNSGQEALSAALGELEELRDDLSEKPVATHEGGAR